MGKGEADHCIPILPRGELEQNLSRRLRASLKRIQDTLILNPDASPEEPVDQDKVRAITHHNLTHML